MEIIYKETETLPPTFGQVKDGQFFVHISGNLCQKCSDRRYNVIADRHGTPFPQQCIGVEGSDYNFHIKRILPEVKQIKF